MKVTKTTPSAFSLLGITSTKSMANPNDLSEDSYRKLKQEVEFAKDEANRSKGALDQLKERLKSDFDCDTLEEAEDKLKSLEKKLSKAEKAFEEALEDYEKKWKGESEKDE